MEEIKFESSVPSRRQVMDEEGYNWKLDQFLDFTPSKESKQLMYDVMNSARIHKEQRARFISLYNTKGDVLLRDLAKSPIRYYAMYLENPQWFRHSPQDPVACGLTAAMSELMKGSNANKFLRFPLVPLQFFTNRAINELYADAKFLKDGKAYMLKFPNGC